MRDIWTHKYVSRRRADSLAREYGRKYAYIEIAAGLHKLEGNERPYFSVTADLYSPAHRNSPFCCGCQHEAVLKFWPNLKPVVDLHLCDDTGAPMHDIANAWYQLAGYYGGAGEQYHVGNSERNFPAPAPPDKPWKDYETRKPTKAECLAGFAEHVRIPVEQARELADTWAPLEGRCDELAQLYPWAPVRAQMAAWIETQRPRWQAEANAACALLDDLNARKAGAA